MVPLRSDRCEELDRVEEVNNSWIIQEAVGVCAFINPWNYPLHQMIGKVAPALAAGCTMVVKPASQTPSHAFILAEAIHAAGVPAGVFNLVHGSGRLVGEAMCKHPEVDMVSFTGSAGAGVRIAELATEHQACLPGTGRQVALDHHRRRRSEGRSGVRRRRRDGQLRADLLDMVIAREEIFGPVLTLIKYRDEEEAIRIANDTEFGLSSAVWASDKEAGLKIARKIRAGQVYVNGGAYNFDAPFGGYKQSGNGREWGGHHGLSEFLETKAIQM